MIEDRRLEAWAGLTLLAAGAIYLPVPFVPGWTGIEAIGARNWWVAHSATTAHHFLVLLGLVGVLMAQLRAAGRLGLAAAALAALGNTLAAGVGMIELAVLPALAANPTTQSALVCTPFHIPATRSAAGFIASACAAWDFAALDAWVGAAAFVLLAGSIALGLTIARAGILPRWTGIALALGALYTGVGILVPLPVPLANLGLAVTGLAYAAAGAALWKRARRG